MLGTLVAVQHLYGRAEVAKDCFRESNRCEIGSNLVGGILESYEAVVFLQSPGSLSLMRKMYKTGESLSFCSAVVAINRQMP